MTSQGRLTRTQFTIQVALNYARRYPDISTEEAMKRAANTMDEFLRYDRIDYGDSRYDWDARAALDVVSEFEPKGVVA